MTAFRAAIYIFALIPLYFGVTGLVLGAEQLMNGGEFTNAMDNQFRYLSGVYIGISAMLFYSATGMGSNIPRRNQKSVAVFRMAVLAVFIGGCARAISYISVGAPPDEMVVGMVLELLSPVLLLWQARVTKSI